MRLLYVSRSAVGHDQRFVDAWRSAGHHVTPVVIGGVTDPARLISDALAAVSPDIVHAGPITDAAWEVCQLWQGPVIAMSWGFDLMDEIDRDEAYLERAREVLTRANRVFVDNDGPRRRAIELGADPDRVVQFPWGIEPHWFSTQRKPPLAGATTTFLSIRRHEEIYRVADLINAFVRIAMDDESLRLRLGGSGTLSGELRALAESTSVSDRIAFLGELDGDRLQSEYATADAYISTSSVDGTSVSLLEAMASGAPVIVADIEGNRQWVVEETGVRFAAGDVAELARAMKAFAVRDDSSVVTIRDRASMARERVAKAANWGVTVAALSGFAEDAVKDWKQR